MTRDETKMIVMQIATSYSKNLMPEVSSFMIDSWHTMLQDLEYKEAALATAALISTSAYPPTIADIRGKLVECKSMPMPAEDAFSLIRQAVQKFGSYRSDEAKEWLGTKIWSAVERYTWEYFCQMSRDNITTYAAQFRRAWEGAAEYERQQEKLPEAIQKRLNAMRPTDALPPCLQQATLEQRKALGITAGGAE